jgi:hypothetical protein
VQGYKRPQIRSRLVDLPFFEFLTSAILGRRFSARFSFYSHRVIFEKKRFLFFFFFFFTFIFIFILIRRLLRSHTWRHKSLLKPRHASSPFFKPFLFLYLYLFSPFFHFRWQSLLKPRHASSPFFKPFLFLYLYLYSPCFIQVATLKITHILFLYLYLYSPFFISGSNAQNYEQGHYRPQF